MSKFDAAIPVILAHEGGAKYTDIKGDAGGPTKFGLSLNRFWRGKDPDDFPQLRVSLSFPAPQTAQEVLALTQPQAEETYQKCWWERFGYGRLDNQLSATKVFDMAVNMKRPTAHRLAQRAANALGATLVPDGVFGAGTVRAINACAPGAFLDALCREHRAFYQAILDRDPSQAKFARGWFERAAWPKQS